MWYEETTRWVYRYGQRFYPVQCFRFNTHGPWFRIDNGEEFK